LCAIYSLVALEAWPWLRGSSRTPCGGLGLGLSGLGLGNAGLCLQKKVLVLDQCQGQDLSKTWEKSWTFSNQRCWICVVL